MALTVSVAPVALALLVFVAVAVGKASAAHSSALGTSANQGLAVDLLLSLSCRSRFAVYQSYSYPRLAVIVDLNLNY